MWLNVMETSIFLHLDLHDNIMSNMLRTAFRMMMGRDVLLCVMVNGLN